MKHILCSLFFFISIFSYSQNFKNGVVIYELSFRAESFKKTDSIKNRELKQIIDNQKNKTYALYFEKNESVFFEEKNLEVGNSSKIDLTSIFADKGTYYFNRNNKELLIQKDLLGETFLVTKTDNYTWILTKDILKIGNYICNKAITYKTIKNRKGEFLKRKIIAWYTTSVPINFGIKDYYGLPGLIIRLEEPMISYQLKRISLNSTESLNIKKPVKGRKITNEELEKLLENSMRKY
jgi:GLPGLI family protein